MDDRERFALNARFCRQQAALQKDRQAIQHWLKLAADYERLAAHPIAEASSPAAGYGHGAADEH
jgi:hypothetical protein